MFFNYITQTIKLQEIKKKLDSNQRCSRKDFETFFWFLGEAEEYQPCMGDMFAAMYLSGSPMNEDPQKTLERLAKKSMLELMHEVLHRK